MRTQALLSFYARLTTRQQEVLELASAGLTNAEIAAELHIEPSVVAEHLTRVYDQLHNLDENGLRTRPNRRIIIRYFTLFYAQYPTLQRFPDAPTLTS